MIYKDMVKHIKMPDIHIANNDIENCAKALILIKPHSPDKFKHIVPKTIHKELAPILQLIYQKLLVKGKLPTIWGEANVSPVCTKGDKFEPTNIFWISLTCVLPKVIEHVVVQGVQKES